LLWPLSSLGIRLLHKPSARQHSPIGTGPHLRTSGPSQNIRIDGSKGVRAFDASRSKANRSGYAAWADVRQHGGKMNRR